jgi:hypothetical protein
VIATQPVHWRAGYYLAKTVFSFFVSRSSSCNRSVRHSMFFSLCGNRGQLVFNSKRRTAFHSEENCNSHAYKNILFRFNGGLISVSEELFEGCSKM